MISHDELDQACAEQSEITGALARLSSLQLEDDDDLEPEYEDMELEEEEDDDDDQASAAGGRLLIQNPTHFTQIAPILEDPEAYYDDEYHDGIAIELPCRTCGRQLVLPDAVMPPATGGGSEGEEEPPEYMAVLPCGHMIGDECLERHLEDQDMCAAEGVGVEDHAARSAAAYAYRSCPVCGFPLGHEECGHAVRTRVYGRDEIPEGSSVGGECRACQLEVPNLLREMMGDLVAALQAAGQPAADLAPSRVEYMERALLDVTMKRLRPRLDRHNLEW